MGLFKKVKAAVKKDVSKVANVAKSAATAVTKVDKAVVKDVGKAATAVVKVDKAIVKDAGKVATTVAKDTVVAAKAVAKEAVKVGKAAWNLNPVGELLRNGMLLLMKINLFNVAGRLKYGYLTDAEATAAGIDLSKLNQVRKVLETLQKAFYDAGGGGLKMDRTVSNNNIKNAILKGSGNKKGLKVSGDGSPSGGGVPTSFIGGEFIGSGFCGSTPANYVGSESFVGGSDFIGGNDYSNVAGVDDAAEASATAGVTALGTTLAKVGDIVSKVSKVAGDAKNAVSSVTGIGSQASEDFANAPPTTGVEAQAEIQRGTDAESALHNEITNPTSETNTGSNTNTYIIIGVVAAVVILLVVLWKFDVI